MYLSSGLNNNHPLSKWAWNDGNDRSFRIPNNHSKLLLLYTTKLLSSGRIQTAESALHTQNLNRDGNEYRLCGGHVYLLSG